MVNSKSEVVEPMEVELKEFVRALNLSVHYDGEKEKLVFNTFSVSRPGLILVGYDTYFAENRVQVLGSAEMEYLKSLDTDKRAEVFENIFSRCIPCLIISRGIEPLPEMDDKAKKYKIPIFLSDYVTSNIVNDVIMYLNDLLAENIVVSGVLMDVHGVGVMITGKSGIGKSETALELVKRGHRLVADDAVCVKNVRETLVGSAPAVIRFLMELRGIGIVDIRSMYGIGSVAREMEVELIIELEAWEANKSYERLHAKEQFGEILGVQVPKITIPVKPGRNTAVIVEVAARNFRLQQEGLNVVDSLI